MSFLINSCSAQSNFDLTDIKLNRDKITEIYGPDAQKKGHDQYVSDGQKKLITKKSEFLYFNKVSFKGQQNPNSKHGINGVTFTYNKKDAVITKYKIHIYSLNEAGKIIKTVHEKLGKPNYVFRDWNDKNTNRNDKLIWEDQDNKTLYLLDISLDSTSKVSLTALYNFNDISKLELFGPYSYWEDYLYERKKKNTQNYSYQDYLKELKEKSLMMKLLK
ncbi:hypothetical protein [Aquimarina agarivorans]|uniref:hypothetical protein n=1 Tax=Aquimarina agarivorans TaxID=980584 RepID=UPI0002E30DCA|nr:hypothetical protein [Aquimarina agarivorans]